MEEKDIEIEDGYILKVRKVKVISAKEHKPFFASKNKTLYNLTIEDDNSFVLNHIITHNTGERGANGWTQFYHEKRPNFTVPIVPINAKAMHFLNEKGEDVFLKKSKGQKPQSYMRRAFKDSELPVKKIWEQEFGDTQIKQHLSKKKVKSKD